jgi:hypothetical protein
MVKHGQFLTVTGLKVNARDEERALGCRPGSNFNTPFFPAVCGKMV